MEWHLLSFWAIFCSLILLTTWKIKALKKWKTHLEISLFYTVYVPKVTIIWFMIPEIWSATDRTVCHFGPFFCHFTSLTTWKIKIWKNEKSIWRCVRNWNRTQNHLVLKRTLNHLVKLAKWSSCVLSTYLYSALDCMFLPCHVRVSEWIHTL